MRSHVAIIPQEPVLFSGTIRSNLDPFDTYDDEVLHDAMQRACLGGPFAPDDGVKITLDTEVEDEGGNLSKPRAHVTSAAMLMRTRCWRAITGQSGPCTGQRGEQGQTPTAKLALTDAEQSRIVLLGKCSGSDFRNKSLNG